MSAASLWSRVILGCAAATACGVAPAATAQQAEPDSVVADQIHAAPFSGIHERRRVLIRDDTQWEAFWAEALAPQTPLPQRPAVDFARHMLIAVTMGRRGTGGHAIAVAAVSRRDGEWVVTVRETSPEAGCITIQAFTAPIQIVRVPASDTPIRFEEQREARPCQ